VYLGGDSALGIAKAYVRSTGYDIKTAWADYTTSGELVTWCEEEGIASIDIVIPASQQPSSTVSEDGTLLDITIQALLNVANYE
jgi:hypothetical protein